MNYSTLTKTQRTCIDAFVKLDPSLASASSITRKQVEELFWKLHEERNTTGVKIGYPMWLVKGQKIGRGSYVFPAPNLTASTSAVVAQKTEVLDKEDEEFFDEIAMAGLLEEVA